MSNVAKSSQGRKNCDIRNTAYTSVHLAKFH